MKRNICDAACKAIECPICCKPMKLSGHGAYYDRSYRYKTPIYYCNDCDIFYRDVDSSKLVDHYYAASYVQKENEDRFFRDRMKFFEYVLQLVNKYSKRIFHGEFCLVDFGSSYGHLLELAKDKGISAIGIELNEKLASSCREKGLSVYKQLSDICEKVDVVTSIDSFYCVPDGKQVLRDIKNILKPEGFFIARVTNRNLYVKFVKRYIRKGDLSGIGDATVSYSLKGIRKLLNISGFSVLKIIPDYGKGKKVGFIKGFYYRLLYLATIFTGKKYLLTPGIFIVARPEKSFLRENDIEGR